MDDTRLMRYGNNYQVIPIKTALDWSAWNVHNDPATEKTTAPGTGEDPSHGLAKAVEMCNNNGHCRKFDAGTMCPSFRVTGEERHLTRGRANTLRLALSGQLGPDACGSDEVREAMELCVSCKGCKRECPTGVDMAAMKLRESGFVARPDPAIMRMKYAKLLTNLTSDVDSVKLFVSQAVSTIISAVVMMIGTSGISVLTRRMSSSPSRQVGMSR